MRGHFRLMGHHHNGFSLGMQLFQDPYDLVLAFSVQIPRRLVSHDDQRIVDQGPGNGHPLLLAAGQFIGPMPQAIMSDPDWQNGDYYGKSIPARGLALSRMIGHITYMSDKSMDEKFGRKLIGKERVGFDFSHDFEVENYLKYRSDSFVKRFDANSYLYLTKSLDYFDLAEDSDLTATFKGVKASFLVISFSSDWLYPSYQSKEMIRALKANDLDVSDCEINCSYGHDAFLIEIEGQSRLISHFLNRLSKEKIYGK